MIVMSRRLDAALPVKREVHRQARGTNE